MMKKSTSLTILVWIITVLAAAAAGTGFFWTDVHTAQTVTSVHGLEVELYGHGLYRYDSVLIASGFIYQDLLILALGIPLLLFGWYWTQRGSLRGGLLLTGTLAYFFYDYLSMAFGAAYNAMFLVYIALVSASLFGFLRAISLFDLESFPRHFGQGLPRKGIAGFLIAVGVIFLIVWIGLDSLPSLLAGQAPSTLMHYTTVTTHVIDLGLLSPAMILTGVLLLRRSPLGYLLAAVLLIFSLVINVQLAVMGLMQYLGGLMSMGQFIGMSGSFDLVALIALGFTIALFRNYREDIPPSEVAKTAQPPCYEIQLEGHLDENWASQFEGFTLSHQLDPQNQATTRLTGEGVDQSALLACLNQLHHIGVKLIGVEQK